MNGEPVIRASNVLYHYGVRPVLRDVSLDVERGQIVALMGPNGMGKSTLMGVLAGTITPLKGYVEIEGQRRRSSPEVELAIRKRVVYLSANGWAPIIRTGRQWLMAVGSIYGIDAQRLMEHIDRLLDLFDSTKQADANISDYSTGQKKKIALCCALVAETPILLLDEPFSGGLDPSGIFALKSVLLHRAKKDRVTIVMATPVPELVEELADRVAVLREGRITAFDSVAKLREAGGNAESLSEAYARLVDPNVEQTVARYLKEER